MKKTIYMNYIEVNSYISNTKKSVHHAYTYVIYTYSIVTIYMFQKWFVLINKIMLFILLVQFRCIKSSNGKTYYFPPSIPLATPWWYLSKTLVMPSLSCAYIHSLYSDWERWLCPSKYFDFVSLCVFVCLSTVISSIFGKSSHFPFPYFVYTSAIHINVNSCWF